MYSGMEGFGFHPLSELRVEHATSLVLEWAGDVIS
jgi:hypothetical protein